MVRIVVEGKDDERFLVKMLDHLKKESVIKTEENNFTKYTQVMNGKSKLLNKDNEQYKRMSKEIETGKLDRVLFVFDCDFEEDDSKCGGMKNSQKCFEELKKELDWDISVDSYIFNKNLDYFLLGTIHDSKCYEKFSDLEKCLKIEKLKKNRKPIATLYRDLYSSEPYDFSHPNFNELKEKLKNLFEGI